MYSKESVTGLQRGVVTDYLHLERGKFKSKETPCPKACSYCKIKPNQHAVILASDAGSEQDAQDAQDTADCSGVRIFSAEIVLFIR